MDERIDILVASNLAHKWWSHRQSDVSCVHVRVVGVRAVRIETIRRLDAQEKLTQTIHAEPESSDEVVVREGGHRREPLFHVREGIHVTTRQGWIVFVR